MSDGVKKKSGAVKFEEYEREEYLQCLGPVSKRLQEQYATAKFDTRSVGNFIALIRQFMEDALGARALPPRICPKIPARLFQDFKPDGALHSILKSFHVLMATKGLKRIDFTNPYHRKQLLDVFCQVVAELQKQYFLQWPKAYLHPSCGPEAAALKDMITALRGEVAPSADAAGVTHHVQPFGPKGDPDDGVQYMRNLGKRGDKALVHWWYYPDSYDEVIDPDDAPELVEVDKQPEGPWKIYTRWVKDSFKYNEWMNPIDYELEDTPATKEASTSQGVVATSALSQQQTGSAAPAARPLAPLPPLGQTAAQSVQAAPAAPAPIKIPEVAPGAGVEIAPGLVKQKLLQPDLRAFNANIATINLCQPQEAKMRKLASRGENHPARKQVKLPASSAWFSLDSVHNLEEEAFARFLKAQGSTDGVEKEEYKTLRNAMVTKYRENTAKHLSFLEASKAVPAKLELLVAIWTFLDSWGLINLTASETAEPDSGASQPGDAGPLSDRETAANAMRNVQALYQCRPLPKPQQGVIAAAGKVKAGGLVGRKPKKRKTLEPFVREARFYCNAMPGVECTKLRYHCTKLPDLDLCPQAFAEGRFPAGCSAKDFVRIDQNASENADESVWSDMDTLLLLEGLELYGDNWAEISDHVGTKSQVQCITHFLKLPIEDDFLDQLEDAERGAAAAASAGQDKADGGASRQMHSQLPFMDQGNPIMAQVAFLAAMVSPEVAAAAAQRALEVLLDDEPSQEQPVNGATPSKAEEGDQPITPTRVSQAAGAALTAASVKARLLADDEERDVQNLMGQAVTAQAELNELRLNGLPQLAQAVREEQASLQVQREALTRERVKLQEAKGRPQPSQQVSPAAWQPAVSFSAVMPVLQNQAAQAGATAGSSAGEGGMIMHAQNNT